MRRVRNQQQVRERLLLDPDPGAVKLQQQLVARRRRIIDGHEASEPSPLVGVDRAPRGARKSPVGSHVHLPRLDRDVCSPGETAEDQDTATVEIAGVPDRGSDGSAHAEEEHHGPACLSAREHDELAAGIHALDVVEERSLVLEHGDAIDGQLDERRIAKLRERERTGIAEDRVTRNVIEPRRAARVHQRTERVDQDGGVVAIETAELERGGERGGGRRGLGGRDVGLGDRVVREQRRGETPGALTAVHEGLAVAEHARGEIRDPDRSGKLEDRVERARDIADDDRRACDIATGGELPGFADSGRRGGDLVGEERAGDRVGRRRKGRQLAVQGVLASCGFGTRVTGDAVERVVEDLVEGEPAVSGDGRALDIDARPARRQRHDGARREHRPERGDRVRVGVDGDRSRQSTGLLATIEDGTQSGAGAGGGGDGSADRMGELHDPDDIAAARRLIAVEPGARAAAFADGLAPLLARGLGGRVAAAITAERSPWYFTILYALLLFRRDHELEPLHEDVLGRVLGPIERFGPYDGVLFAQDVEQLVRWRAVDRVTEAHKLRSYRDNRRERFRYRLTDDAVALLEWLEARLAARLDGRAGDSRDRLTDVLGHLREVRRVLDAWREGAHDVDPARRALYLFEAIGDAIDDVGTELLTFRGEMLAFASRPYELDALRAILVWLERYVGLYVRRIEELRADIEERFRELAAPRFRVALEDCRAVVTAERAAGPRALRGAPITAPADRTAAHVMFFAPDGVLAQLCARIDASARAVVLKMQRYLRELERRNARLGDLRTAIRAVAAGPATASQLGELGTALVASAHARFDEREASAAKRATPPVPRGHARTTAPAARQPLARKQDGIEAVRELAARRRQALGAWLARVVGDAARVRLSARGLASPDRPTDAPRQWLDVARAWHLHGGKEVAAMGFAIVAEAGEAIVGDGSVGLAAPDCTIERKT